MAIYGADPEQLAQLGRTLNQQIDVITQMMSTVESTFAGTIWHGPARQRFEQEWNQSFRQALARLNEAFGAAGRDCLARSSELHRVMGV
jgi:uncharacterized protein YukE